MKKESGVNPPLTPPLLGGEGPPQEGKLHGDSLRQAAPRLRSPKQF
ncbi:MAG: hypothetical protein F6K60_29285 [Okeania sp. SIO1F9]|nr:hypothetical protein [Okeania sp. SIO1F9]